LASFQTQSPITPVPFVGSVVVVELLLDDDDELEELEEELDDDELELDDDVDVLVEVGGVDVTKPKS
jgi:hypothetical protein